MILMGGYVRAAITGVAILGTAALAACGGSSSSSSGTPGTAGGTGGRTASATYNAAYDKIVNPSRKKGGTLQLGLTSDCDSWDPQRVYYGFCWNLQRLFTRGLTGYSKLNGNTFQLSPDAATTMGVHNADYTQWTYTLKPGLKWSNGKPVTPLDFKYGVERLFAQDVITGGAFSYYVNILQHPSSYKGPYHSGDLTSIRTTANTITYNLVRPFKDFPYLLALPEGSAVPDKVEGGAGYVGRTYTKRPLSDGPFKIASYTPGKSINFVRNPDWSQSTDPIRHPVANAIDISIDTNPGDLDNKIKAGLIDANAGVGAGGLTPAFQSYVLTHPQAKKQADDPATPFTEYFAVFQTVIKNADCRKAIFYATNKASIIAAEGGPTAGIPAGSMTPPGVTGYDKSYNPYPAGPQDTGNLAKAKAELKACGKPNGFPITFAYPTPSQKAPLVFAAEKAALTRVGITSTGVSQDTSTYYSTFIGSPKNVLNKGIGIALAGWGADFPRPVGYYNAIANGNAITDPGTSNYPSLNDPVINKILDNGSATDADYATLRNQVMTDAVYLPIYWGATLMYRNPRMTNVTCDNALAFGNYDFVNIGVK
jgi:peptide/nickel transport system substrate-binding protein